jgi:hypothetical protein
VSDVRPLSWFLRSVCHRYRIDSNLSSGQRVYVGWFTSTQYPERIGEWSTPADAKAGCAAHSAAIEQRLEEQGA